MPFQLRGALRDFRRTWPQLLIAELLALALGLIVAAPLLGLLLKLFLLATEEQVLTDAGIAAFLLHPLGLLGLLVLGALGLGLSLFQLGLVMVIGYGAQEDRLITYLDALRYVGARFARFVRLSARILGHALLLAAPFLLAIGGLYLWLLRAHDINYYLTAHPPEFTTALALAGLLLAVLSVLLLRAIAGWTLALPLLLFSDVDSAEAMRRSRAAIAPQRWRIVAFLAGWLAGTTLVSAVVSLLLGRLGSALVPTLDSHWLWLALSLGLTLALIGLTQQALQFLTRSLLPLFAVRWFRELAGPGKLVGPHAAPGSLGASASWSLPGRKLLALAFTGVVLAVALAYAGARSLDGDATAVVIAHRGASAAAPENTRAAFERAAADGADWIELDVQETAEGVVVVAHDSDFMKQAHVGLKVWDATAADLADIDIGSWFAPEFADQRALTLREVLTWAKGRIGVVIELKYYGHDDQLEARVAAIVESTEMQDDVMVMSLSRPGLRDFAAIRPTWTRGLLNTASLGDLTRLDVDFLALNAAAATRAQIRAAHASGKRVYVWTVNDPVQMSVVLSRGADGLITDVPARARELLELREDLTPIGRFLVWVAGETGLLELPDKASSATDA